MRFVLAACLAALCGAGALAADNNYDTLVKSAREFEHVHSLHMHREGGTPTDVDYVAPDRYRVTYGTTEIIWIGKVQYVRDVNGPWTAQITSREPPFQRSVIEDAIGKLQKADIKDLGAAKLGNLMTHRYEITTPEKAVATVWIGQTDGLTYRIENRRPDGTFDSAYVYSNFNSPIKIDPPPGVAPPSPVPAPFGPQSPIPQ